MQNTSNHESIFEPCLYSIQLIHTINNINSGCAEHIDIEKVKIAIFYARKYHGTQMRQSGEPYYSHPLAVAEMVAKYLPKTDIIITSILHDILEDTVMPETLIAQLFGQIVLEQVQDLTRKIIDGRKTPVKEMIDKLWHEKKYEVLLIKQFDRLHNMQTIEAKSIYKQQKIINETIEVFMVLAVFLETKAVEKELMQLCGVEHYTEFTYTPFKDNFQLPSLNSKND